MGVVSFIIYSNFRRVKVNKASGLLKKIIVILGILLIPAFIINVLVNDKLNLMYQESCFDDDSLYFF